MAIQSLFVKSYNKKGKIGAFTIDGVISEQTSRSMRVTSNPIESGEVVADHIIREPMRYTMQGILTNSPLGLEAFARLPGSVVDAVTGLFGKSETSGVTRSVQLYNSLYELMYKKELVKVQTNLSLYENLIFESITVNTDKTTANSVAFTATFIEAISVKSARFGIDPDDIEDEKDRVAYSSSINSGSVASTPLSEEKREKLGILEIK